MEKRKNTMLIRARRTRIWSQQEAANNVGVDKKTYSNWEKGQIPQPKYMRMLCEAFEVSPEELGYEQFNNSYRVRDVEVAGEGK